MTVAPVVPPVATYVDDTPLFVNLRLQDIDHVEVLLDGASALYGSDAVGGVVNIILRRNFDGAETRAQGQNGHLF